MEKELEEIKVIKKNQLIHDYNDLIEWLMMLYNNPRFEVQDDQTRSVNQAYIQTCKIAQMVEMQENKLKNERIEIENTLVRQKRDFVEILDDIKSDVDKFKENENKKKEDEYNKNIA